MTCGHSAAFLMAWTGFCHLPWHMARERETWVAPPHPWGSVGSGTQQQPGCSFALFVYTFVALSDPPPTPGSPAHSYTPLHTHIVTFAYVAFGYFAHLLFVVIPLVVTDVVTLLLLLIYLHSVIPRCCYSLLFLLLGYLWLHCLLGCLAFFTHMHCMQPGTHTLWFLKQNVSGGDLIASYISASQGGKLSSGMWRRRPSAAVTPAIAAASA